LRYFCLARLTLYSFLRLTLFRNADETGSYNICLFFFPN
jgi:hypothetical protein